MPRQQKRRSGRRRQTAANRVLHEDMKQLLVSSKLQQLSMQPRVLDIPRISFRPTRVFNFCETYGLGALTPSTTGPVLGAYQFQLSALQNALSYGALFDNYRYIQIEVQAIPRGQMAPGMESTFLSVIDYDDNAVPSSIQDLYQYDTLQVSPPGVMISRIFRPKYSATVYTTGGGSAYAQGSGWVDIGYPNTPYYGFKFGLNSVSVAPTGPQYDLYASIYLQCKSQR